MNNLLPLITNQPLDVLIGALVGYFASIYKYKNNTTISLSKTYAEATSQEIKQLQSDIVSYRERIDILQKANENLADQNYKLIESNRKLKFIAEKEE